MASSRSRLADRVCVVTGASSGIGRAIALAFAREGAAFVLCADLRPDAAVAAVAAGDRDRPADSDADAPPVATHELIARRHGDGRAAFRRVDVTVEEEVRAMVDAVVERAGRLDVIVNNAGVGPAFTPLHETSDQVWSGTVDVNLRAPFLCSKYAIRQFLKQEANDKVSEKRGSIINIASAAGLREVKFSAAYCASKAGVISLTKATALEYGNARIQCNAICPGTILTPMTAPMLQSEEVVGFFKSAVPWGEGGVGKGPEEIANAAVWLASNEAGWVTGVALPVDGGIRSMRDWDGFPLADLEFKWVRT